MLIHNSPTTYNNALRCMPLVSPILKNETTEMVRNLPNITQPGFKSRQSLVSESTLLILNESVFIPWHKVFKVHPYFSMYQYFIPFYD